MRAKLLLLSSLFVLTGCAKGDPDAPPAEFDAEPETIGIDTAIDTSSPPDTGSDSGEDVTVDSAMPETAADGASDTAIDAAPDTTIDVAPDTAVDTATDTRVDSALDVADTSVVDAAFPAAPMCDGTVATGEYASQYTHTGTSNTWRVTWDDTSLYFAIENANVAEASVIYIDANPVSPPSGGTDANGSIAGYTYDSTKLATLPFRANVVVYAKSGYREYRTSDGAGGWSSPTTTFGCFASSGTTRELSIPWSAVGGRPSSFGFLGYVTSGAGFVYGEIPMANPDGAIGTSAAATKYFHVSATGPTSTATAFSDER